MLVPSWLDDGGVDGSNPTKLPTLLQAQRQVVNTCHACLSDCDVYLAMHEALPSPPAASPAPLLRFVACSPKSAMLHRALPCSLDENQASLLPPDNNSSGSGQRAKNDKPGSVSTAAVATRRPVVIQDIQDYYVCPIVTFTSSATPTGPFACFPLVSQQPIERQQPDEEEDGAAHSISLDGPPAIGVLSIDACRKAERQWPEAMTVDEVYQFLVHEKQRDTAIELRKLRVDGTRLLLLSENDVMHKPAFQRLKIAARKKLLELIQSLKRGSNRHLQHDNNMASMPRFFTDDPEALTFLTRVSEMAGVFLDGYRAVHWSREMASVTRDPACSVYDVFEALVRAVARAISCVRRVAVWKIVPSTYEISAIASTEVPEDRLQPFLRWEERLIKRVALYKELEIPIDAGDDGNEASSDGLKLLQGSISKPVFFQSSIGSSNGIPSPPTGSTAPVCETATYNVAWANRTYQSLTWRQLRQLLPIRPMNSKHYQLKLLLQQLANAPSVIAPDDRRESLTLSDPNALVLTIRDEFRPRDLVYALEVDFPRDLPPHDVRSPASVAFLQRAVAITERSLLCVHGRTRRRMRRERSVAALSQRFGGATPSNGMPTTGGALMPSRDALRALDDVVAEIFQDITENLPGADVQVAELQPDGAQLKFTFVGGRSTVEVNRTVLQRGQGLSFRCLDTKTPLVVNPTASPDMHKRLRWLSQPRRDQERDGSPFLFVPLVHEDCAVGVLSVDSFHDVPKGRRDESHPERGVVEYLLALGNLLATAIYTKRRSFALYELQQLVNESPLRSPHQLFLGACRALRDVMVGTWKVRLMEVDCTRGKTSLVYDYSEAERASENTVLVAAIEPLRLRWKEILADTVASHTLPAAVAAASTKPSSAIQTVDGLIAVVDKLEREDLEQHAELRALIASRHSLGLPLVSSEKQRVQAQRIRDTYFLLLPPPDGDTDTSTASSDDTAAKTAMRVSNEKYSTHALGVFLSTKTFSHALVRAMVDPPNVCVFLAVSCLPQFHAECDRGYVNRVAEVLTRGVETCQARVERSRARVNAVERFRLLCEQEVQRQLQAMRDDISGEHDDGNGGVKDTRNAKRPPYRHRLSPSEELEVEALTTLQRRAIELVQTELNHPDVYIGLLEPSRDRLKYTSASVGSAMLGKQLKRGVGVSFNALVKQTPVVITRQDAVDGPDSPVRRLRFYSNKPMKWPFIVVPVGHAGVVALDNLEKYERLAGEAQPELGLVDFVRHVATALGDALARVRRATREYRQQLRNQSLLRVMATCEDRRTRPAAGTITASSPFSAAVPPLTPLFLLHHVMHQLERALNGVNAYVGLVDPLCRCIRFVCATSASGMERQSVDATRSVSFHVFASQQTTVVPDLRAHYCSLIESQRLATAQDSDAGDSASLMQPSARWLKFFGANEPSGAFVCVPIPFVGVLSVDTFPGAANGQYSPVISSPAPPEEDVVEFLEQTGTLIGKSIRAQRANALRAMLPTLFRGNRSTFPDLFRSVLTHLSENLPAVIEMHAVRFPKTECYRCYAWPSWKDAAIATLARSREDGGGASRTSDDAEVAQYFDKYYRKKCSRCDQLPGDAADSDDGSEASVIQLPRRPEVVVVHCIDTRDVAVDVGVGNRDGLEALRHTALVFKRVEGATWTYDADLLRETLPVINDLIQLVNPRVQGIVRRRMVLRELDRMGEALEAIHPATEAVSVLRQHTLPAAVEVIAWAMSGHREHKNPCCDVYLGERSVFVSGSGSGAGACKEETRPALRYVAASKHSLMAGVTLDLARPEVQTMVTVQSLEKCTKTSVATPAQSVAVVHIPQDASAAVKHPGASDKKRSLFFGRGHSHAVTPLTLKPAQRVFLAVPMGNNHVLCADSLSVEALTPALSSSASRVAHQVEADVVAFFQAAANTLLSTIQSTQWRASFTQLRALRTVPHSNLRAFFDAVLDVLHRDLVRFHSSQILRLGEDFTRDYDVTAWLGAPTRRDGSRSDGKKRARVPDHLCYANDCTSALLAKDIHYETRVRLPMTNVPRTLDASRSTQQPAEGVEKRGAFATSCLAIMLDASVVERSRRAGDRSGGDARWALCVFHHDVIATDESEKRSSVDGHASRRQTRRQWQPVTFTAAQRQYFFALSAVASDVFVDVLRACVLDSSATELAFVLLEQEELSAVKELVVVRILDEDGGDESAAKSSVDARVLFSTMPTKHTAGSVMRRGKLATKLTQFHPPPRATDLAVFMTRKAVAPAVTTASVASKVTSAPPVAPVAPANASSPVSSTAEATTKPRGVAAFLFGGGRSLFKKRKHDDGGQPVAKPPTPAEVAVQKAATTLAPRQAPPVTLYVLLRALEQPNARCTDYVLMVMENTTVSSATAIEAGVRRVKQQVDAAFAATGVGSQRFPRGDEECNAKRFCARSHDLLLGDDGGGGGFLLLEMLKQARDQLCDARVPLEAAMRDVLLKTHNKPVALPSSEAKALSRPDAADAETAVSTPSDQPRGASSSSALVIATRGALAAVGGGRYARDQLVTMTPVDLCREFLRVKACDAVLALDLTDRRTWSAISRARALLSSTCLPASGSTTAATSTAATETETVGADTSSPPPLSPTKQVQAPRNEGVAALTALLRACFAVVRYLRHLKAAMTRTRRETLDAPATVVQCAYRCALARRELKRRRLEFAAALTIQCAFRQHLARRARLFREWTRAAERVQRAFRARRARRLRGGRVLAARVKGELRAVAGQLRLATMGSDGDGGENGNDRDDGTWQRDMAAFDSFAAYAASRSGKVQLKREEALLHKRRRAITAERAAMRDANDGDADDSVMWAELGDVFELLDKRGEGELSRERVRELMARVHVPLDASEADDVVAMMDSDGSGAISLQKFLAWFAHELPGLRRRSRDCGRLGARDWQWVVRESARGALRKRWRAVRGAGMPSHARAVEESGGDDGEQESGESG